MPPVALFVFSAIIKFGQSKGSNAVFCRPIEQFGTAAIRSAVGDTGPAAKNGCERSALVAEIVKPVKVMKFIHQLPGQVSASLDEPGPLGMVLGKGIELHPQFLDLFFSTVIDLVPLLQIKQGRRPAFQDPTPIVLARKGPERLYGAIGLSAYQDAEHLSPGFSKKIIRGKPGIGLIRRQMKIDSLFTIQRQNQFEGRTLCRSHGYLMQGLAAATKTCAAMPVLSDIDLFCVRFQWGP